VTLCEELVYEPRPICWSDIWETIHVSREQSDKPGGIALDLEKYQEVDLKMDHHAMIRVVWGTRKGEVDGVMDSCLRDTFGPNFGGSGGDLDRLTRHTHVDGKGR
jgi:hypothetical protein